MTMEQLRNVNLEEGELLDREETVPRCLRRKHAENSSQKEDLETKKAFPFISKQMH